VWIEEENGSLKEIKRPLITQSKAVEIERLGERRPPNIDRMVDAAQQGHSVWPSIRPSDWNLDTILGPNVTDKDTILTFAHMMANAYEPESHKGAWKDVGGGFNDTFRSGWEEDGIRGYIYANEDTSVVVVSIKGGSLAI
jgi:lipase ATG15